MATIDGGDDKASTGPEPATEVAERRRGVSEMLHGEVRQDHVEGRRRERGRIGTQVDGGELVEVGERARKRRVDIGADESGDAGAEVAEGGSAPAAGVQDGDAARRCTGLSGGDRLLEQAPNQLVDVGRSSGAHHADAVLASAIPCDSSHRSASIAARQPSPAAVTAWR